MKKRIYAAIFLTSTIVLSSSFTVCAEPVAFADGQEHVINEDVVGNKQDAAVAASGDNTRVTVNGSVSQCGVGILSGSGANIQVTGNVSAEKCGVDAESASATVIGNVTAKSDKNDTNGIIAVNDGSKDMSVVVNGDVTAKSEEDSYGLAVFSNDMAKTVVSVGSVTVQGTGYTSGVVVSKGSIAVVKGDLNVEDTGDKEDGNDSTAINSNGSGNIAILGDVNAVNASGVSIIDKKAEDAGTVFIGGTLSVDDNQYAIALYEDTYYAPSIAVSEIDAANYVGVWSDEEQKYVKASDEVTDKVMKNSVYYFINVEDNENGNTTFDGIGYGIEKEGTKLIVKVVADDGYEVKGVDGGKAAVTQNDDGTYTITVPRGGGVNIKAIIEAIIRNNSSSVSSETTTEKSVEPSKYPQVVSTATKSLGAADANGNVLIDLGEFTTINRALVQAMASRADVSYTLRYKYKGQLYQMVIPAGSDRSKYLDENGFCGVLYLGTVYPATIVAS